MNILQIAVWVGGGLVILAALTLGANAILVNGPGSALEAAANGSLTVNGSLGVSAPGDETTTTGPSQIDPSLSGPPTDPDGDGIFEDLNGNGGLDFDDVVVFFQYILDPAVTDHTEAFDSNGNGRVDFDDIVRLFREI